MKKEKSPDEVEKIKRYCAYQERCHSEVRTKLRSFKLSSERIDEIITQLITEGFLNEERFAKAFAGGKFRVKKWGRLKIVNALEQKNVSKNCIKAGLKEIPSDDYSSTLENIILSKAESVDDENIYAKRDKISKYAIARGFEPDLVWEVIREKFPDQR